MCGIVAAASHRDVVPMLLEGLRRLEYRGYDSCGVATLDQGVLKRARTVSRVHELVERVAEDGVKGTVGIAHTRWATHGAPEVCNAHPHISRNRIALVHNGIIENHEEIRRELQAKGYEFTSQTDTEVVAHLINDNDDGDLLKAVMTAVTRLRGFLLDFLTACLALPSVLRLFVRLTEVVFLTVFLTDVFFTPAFTAF